MTQQAHATKLLVSSDNYLIIKQAGSGGAEENIYLTKEQCALIADEMETLAAMEKWEPGETTLIGEY